MDVKLLYHTPDPDHAVAAAARICYSKMDASDIMDSMSDDQMNGVLNRILGSGHYSALEHAGYTFSVGGVSRALTHQLVRHRIASFNQQSQRYVEFDVDDDGVQSNVVKPKTISGDAGANAIFDLAMDTACRAYSDLLGKGIPAEDARYVLPNAAKGNIVVTMNARELLHFFELRCCNRAQWEIRELAWRMLELARPTAPIIFKHAGPPCVRGRCNEGSASCGRPYDRVPD